MIAGIVVALPEELTTLTSTRLKKGDYIKLSEHLLIAHSGAGFKNARVAAELLISQGATRLISWGCAAALADNLKPGDLTLPPTLLDANHLQIASNSAWHSYTQNLLANSLPVHSGALLESQEIVALSHEKKHLHLATNAIVLDMESVAIAKVALQNNLPFLAIRAIADPVTMDLPKAVVHALNEQGEIILPRLLSYLLVHPTELAGLIQLGLHFHAAKKTLKQVATQLDTIIAFNC